MQNRTPCGQKIKTAGKTRSYRLLAALGIATSELNLGTDIMTAQGPTVIKAGAPVVFNAPFSRLRMPHSGNKLR
jgi:hypothetical protein